MRISTKYFGRELTALPERAVITAVSAIFASLKRELPQDAFVETDASLPAILNRNNSLLIIQIPCGAAHLLDLMYVLSDLHVVEVYFVGLCGGLQEGCVVGDILVPSMILKLESVSDCIDGSRLVETECFHQSRVRSVLNRLKREMAYKSGSIATVASLYQEINLLEGLRQMKIAGIDMETSTLYAAAKGFDMLCCALLIVSDLPVRNSIFFMESLSGEVTRKIDWLVGILVSALS